MPVAQRMPGLLASDSSVEQLLEALLGARSKSLERRVLAATLQTLSEWLAEQARLLSDQHDDEARASNLRMLPRPTDPYTPRLTRRETEIVVRIERGLSNREIAEDLVIATSTTERHVANILNKLGMRSRAQVAAWAVRRGL